MPAPSSQHTPACQFGGAAPVALRGLQDEEFVAAQAGDGIAAAYRLRESPRAFAQHFVADGVTGVVVDFL
jgi:hypothetical protein